MRDFGSRDPGSNPGGAISPNTVWKARSVVAPIHVGVVFKPAIRRVCHGPVDADHMGIRRVRPGSDNAPPRRMGNHANLRAGFIQFCLQIANKAGTWLAPTKTTKCWMSRPLSTTNLATWCAMTLFLQSMRRRSASKKAVVQTRGGTPRERCNRLISRLVRRTDAVSRGYVATK